MSLSDTAVRAAKPRQKPYKLTDEKGLYLLVHPRGGRYWRLKYRLHRHEKLLALGVYPDVSLAQARERRDAARKLIADHRDPAIVKREGKAAAGDSFKAIALEWLAKQNFAPATRDKCEWMINDLLIPYLGDKPIRTISPPDVLSVLRKLEARGKIETAHRTKQRAGQVFRYAIATGRAERDPTADLRGALTAIDTQHRPAITDPKRVGELLRAIDGYVGQPTVCYALKLAPLLFTRPTELRAAEWSEFHLEGKTPEWRIPAQRTKMRDAHLVPLSRQVVSLLKEYRPISSGRLMFPSLRTAAKPLSEATLGAALRRLGYASSEMTVHGFRSMASTLLNEQGFAPDVIELQLAHKERNKVRAAYNQAQRLEERRAMMQAWADYLDRLRKPPRNVVELRRRGRAGA
jgi:integrase